MYNNIKKFINDSFFAGYIDNIAYAVLLCLLFAALFCDSGILGLLGFVFCFIVVFKLIFINNNSKYNLEAYEKALIIYFLFVTVSLFASSLFMLSLHGYLKTLTYILFYFSAGVFFKKNKDKILPLFVFTAALAAFESFVAIAQNFSGVSEISGWQDMTNLNPEQVVSRAYGTLKPYNPNLLAGYLLCTLSSFVYLILISLERQNKKRAALLFFAFLINVVAIIDTGCRGAYLGFLFFFPVLFFVFIGWIKEKFGGLSKIKKRYKNAVIGLFFALCVFVCSNPALIKRFESIFALRGDSSISFRFNVYESVWRMFLDNIVFGIGVGNQNFREIYGLYMKTGFDALGSYCVPLEIAVESGMFAFFAFVMFVVLSVRKSFIGAKSFDIAQKALCLSVILTICAVFGHGLFDTIWFRPQVQFLFWCEIAMLKSIDVK